MKTLVLNFDRVDFATIAEMCANKSNVHGLTYPKGYRNLQLLHITKITSRIHVHK